MRIPVFRIAFLNLILISITSCKTRMLLSEELTTRDKKLDSSFCYVSKKNSSIFLSKEEERIIVEGYIDDKWIICVYKDTLIRNPIGQSLDTLYVGRSSYLKSRNGYVILKDKNSYFSSKLVMGDRDKLRYYRNTHFSDSLMFIEGYDFPNDDIRYNDEAVSMSNKEYKAFILRKIDQGVIIPKND